QGRRSGMNWNLPRVRLAALTSSLVASGLGIALVASTTVGQADEQSVALASPSVPADIQTPEGNTVFRVGHAKGTQNYVCLPTTSGFAFALFTPEATLFGNNDRQLITHYFSPNPFEGDTIRATWQDSRDTSTVWGQAVHSSSDPTFVAPDAIAWVLLQQ